MRLLYALGQRMTKLSIRRLWVMYKRAVLQECLGRYKRDHVQVLAQNAFYLGAQSTQKVLGHLLERGDIEELHRTIERQGRQIKVIQGGATRKRRHSGMKVAIWPLSLRSLPR